MKDLLRKKREREQEQVTDLLQQIHGQPHVHAVANRFKAKNCDGRLGHHRYAPQLSHCHWLRLFMRHRLFAEYFDVQVGRLPIKC